MNKNPFKYLGGVAVILVVAAVIFVFNSGNVLNEPTIMEVSSDDGAVKLLIPEFSLPEGVGTDQISVTKSYFTVVDNGEALSYELLPDGLKFNEPITIILETSLSEATEQGYSLPLLLHKTVDGQDVETEIVNDTLVTIDEENGKMIVTGEISHFSNIALWQVSGLMAGRAHSDSTEHQVGDNFEFKATIQPTKRTDIFRDDFGYDEFTFAWGSTWGVRGHITTSYARYILPEEFEVVRRTGLTIHQAHEIQGNFSCARRGNELINEGNNRAGTSIDYTINHKRWSTFGQELRLSREENRDYTARVTFRERHYCLNEGEQVPEPDYVSTYQAPADPDNLNCPGVELLSPDAGGREVPVYKLNDGKCYAAEQFHSPSNRDECPEVHYHYSIMSLDRHFRNDSEPCGSVRASDITGRGSIWVR